MATRKRKETTRICPKSLTSERVSIFDSLKNAVTDHILKSKNESVLQAFDAFRVFYCHEGRLNNVSPSTFAEFPNSPTAQRYSEAFKLFLIGKAQLYTYPKVEVETDED